MGLVRRQLLPAALLFLASHAAAPAAAPARGPAAHYYVADCEADPNALTNTRDAIRSRRKDPTEPATVAVRGTCRLSAPMELEKQDSHVRWQGGTISGGVEVGGWHMFSEAHCAGCGAIWVANLPEGTAPARQLWVGPRGVRANRTTLRLPQTSATKTDTGMNTTVGANWTRPAAIEMVYAGNQFCLGGALKKPSSPNFFTWQRLSVHKQPNVVITLVYGTIIVY